MAITTLDGYIAGAKERINWVKTATRTTVAAGYFSLFDIAGSPGAGTLSAGNTANGVVHTDATTGYRSIAAFGGGATGYVSAIDFTASVACRFILFDRLFTCGAYAFNANTALASQPSFLGRVPGGNAAGCANNTELWAEAVTAFTGNQTWNVTYTNQAGTASRTTGATGIGAAPTVGRCFRLPLQAGDTGVSLVTNVAGGTGTAGTANINVLRRLVSGRCGAANFMDTLDMLRTGMRQIFADSALYVLIAADSTSSGAPDIDIEIVNG